MSDDIYDNGPESDPYCVHWISVFDEEHAKLDLRCENCGEPCAEHPIIWGGWCPNAPEGTKGRERFAWKHATWPTEAQQPVPSPSNGPEGRTKP